MLVMDNNNVRIDDCEDLNVVVWSNCDRGMSLPRKRKRGNKYC